MEKDMTSSDEGMPVVTVTIRQRTLETPYIKVGRFLVPAVERLFNKVAFEGGFVNYWYKDVGFFSTTYHEVKFEGSPELIEWVAEWFYQLESQVS